MAITKTIKGISWKRTSPQKGCLNEILENKDVQFCEKHKNGIEDVVVLRYQVEKKQYGEYAEEYLPSTVSKDGHKVIDITALLIDEEACKGIWYLLDVKADVGGEDVIFHLQEQWRDAYQYLKNSVLNYLPETFFQENIGVVTRNYDSTRIKLAIDHREKTIQEIEKLENVSLAMAKKRNENIKLKQEVKYLSDFLEKRFVYKDKQESKNFVFKVILEKKINENEYKAEVNVKLS